MFLKAPVDLNSAQGATFPNMIQFLIGMKANSSPKTKHDTLFQADWYKVLLALTHTTAALIHNKQQFLKSQFYRANSDWTFSEKLLSELFFPGFIIYMCGQQELLVAQLQVCGTSATPAD